MINIHEEFDNSKEVKEIQKKINTAFDSARGEIENKKIEDKATFDSFLQELDNILNYLKSIETKIKKRHNGECGKYNDSLQII